MNDITAESFIEVHSGSFPDTVRKCIIVATDLLRLRRMYDINVNQITGFAFPKLPEPSKDSSNQQCAVKVVVSWLDLRFKYPVEKLSHDQVADQLRSVVAKFSPLVPANECRQRMVVRLSNSDLSNIGRDAIQIPSQWSILVYVGAEDSFYKYPTVREEEGSLLTLGAHALRGLQYLSSVCVYLSR